MTKLSELAIIESGRPPLRMRESSSKKASLYRLYGQPDLESDFHGASACDSGKWIRTKDKVSVLKEGDLVFSLGSGMAAIVGSCHDGYLLTQNFVKITPIPSINSKYLAYRLNENKNVRRQLVSGCQGSVVMKYTVKQLSDLQLGDLPSQEIQKLIGELYFNQLKLNALKKHQSDLETKLVIERVNEADQL